MNSLQPAVLHRLVLLLPGTLESNAMVDTTDASASQHTESPPGTLPHGRWRGTGRTGATCHFHSSRPLKQQ
jgi:hypothetical protein